MNNESRRPNPSTRGRVRLAACHASSSFRSLSAKPDRLLALVFGLFVSLVLGLATPAQGQPSATSGGGDLELRGYTRIGNDHAFSIRNTETGESEWVWAGEPGEYFTIEGFDPEKQVLTVRYRNRVSTVTLQRARIDHANAPVTATLPSFEPPTPPPGQQRTGQAADGRAADRTATESSGGARPMTGASRTDGDLSDVSNGQTQPGTFIPGGFHGSGGSETPPETPLSPPAGDEEDSAPDSIGPPPPPPNSPPPSYTPST